MASNKLRKIRHTRVRKKVSGSTERPRLAVHFSGRNITAQVIDDQAGVTLVSANTTEKELKPKAAGRANVANATEVGKLVAQRGAAKNIRQVVFDRGGNKYHGKVKALADAAREAGFEF
ncbi:MAG: 50S ribosomal protein L18 [Terrimicrobiaceae bacterium]|nr:50S ribosomal protein L18 [Terrimicrobiaceae bacterium]